MLPYGIITSIHRSPRTDKRRSTITTRDRSLRSYATPWRRLESNTGGRHAKSQPDSAWGALDGSARDTAGASLVGVEVVAVDNATVRARTGAGGAFRIDSITAGPHLIRFRRIAGLIVSGEPGRRYVSNTRGVSAIYDQVDDKGVHQTKTNCNGGMSVYINGAHADGNVDMVAPSDIAAIEIYKDPVEIPVTLDRSPCEAIYIWTK